MSENALLSQEELEDAAFYLLTCSTVERYLRMAKSLALKVSLIGQLHSDPGLLETILARARTLRKQMLNSTKREAGEFELAVLLSILAQTASSQVNEDLLTLALWDRPPMAWISALARNLRSERSCDEDLIQHFVKDSSLEAGRTKNSADDDSIPLFDFSLTTSSPEKMVGQLDEPLPIAA